MSENAMTLSEVIDHIKDKNAELKNSELALLSDLPTEAIIKVRMAWEFLPSERKRAIAERLNEMEDDDTTLSFDNLFRFMLSDRDEQVKILAIRGLWENEQPSLLEPLVRLLEKDKSSEVRAEAAGALGKYAMMAEMGQLREALSVRVKNVLFKAIEDPAENASVKARALEAISPVCEDRVTEAIKKAYASGNQRLKIASIYAMGKNALAMWLPILVAELKSEEPEERYEAVVALGEMEDETAMAYLRHIIHDDDMEVRLAATEALRKTGGREAKALLGEMINDDNESISEAAKEALSELEEPALPKNDIIIDDIDVEDEIEEDDDPESFRAA